MDMARWLHKKSDWPTIMADTQSQNLVLPGESPAFFIYFYRLFAKLNKLFAYFSKLFAYFLLIGPLPLK